jgi:two-component system phosphate regulon sensor histidine kinase PhoR
MLKTGELSPNWLEVLYEIGRQLASSLDLDEVLSKVLALTAQSLETEIGSIFLLDARGRVVNGILSHPQLSPLDKLHLADTVMRQGFAGWVYRQQKADIILDTQTDSRWHVFPDDPLPIRSAMAAPLVWRGAITGIITLTHPEPGHFTKRQLELLEAIAGQAASAVENAALYTRVKNEHAMLQAVIGGVQDIIVATDLMDCLMLVNPAAQRQLGLPHPAARPRASLLLLGKSSRPEESAGARRPLAEVMTDPALLAFYQSAKSEAQRLGSVTLADGRVFDCALVAVPGVGRVWGMHDVTTFKQLDALKSEFVEQVSHDLKAPLGVVMGYAQLLRDSSHLDADELGHVQVMIKSVRRMEGLIDSLLDMSLIEMGLGADFERVDLAQVVRGALDDLQPSIEDKRITLTFEVALAVPPVRGVPVRLGQAVTNLVDNALKFTPPGGRVDVRLAVEGREVVLRVRDTGPGIPPAAQAKLFQKFSRVGQQRASEGHGLGLSIVRSVAEAHGGRAWVESQAGAGSTFALALPTPSA